ncbi:hypothetical protein FIU88_09545 [Halomonas sp. THAF12]|uniref:hypothetical protein n=1 Tax=Halomonas sp. THAF12 TaxID=2587849 RepID=UPI001268F4DA|nr:hypothetical protein [Halomonas sp. THAF12]QFT85219.1 hypothetical protein FIU88_09545 [Halomonas sp. THAF12]
MNKTAQTPIWIIERHHDLFHTFRVENKLLHAYMSLIKYFLPPPNRPDLLLACELFTRDHAAPIPSALIDAIENTESLNANACTTAGTQYPVWYALSHSGFLNRQQAGTQSARQILTNWFTPIERHAEPSIYLDQTRDVRDVLKVVLDTMDRHSMTLATSQDVIRIMGHPTMREERGNLDKKYKTFYELHEAQRRPGVRIGHNLSGYKKKAHHSEFRKELNRYQKRRREQITDAPFAHQQLITETTAAERFSGEGQIDKALTEPGYRFARHTPSNTEFDDTPSIPVIQRTTPSQLTPADDRRAARKAVEIAATNTLATLEDVHRLTPWQTRQVLKMDMPPLERAITRLLLVTGMPVNRLAKIQRTSHDGEPTDEIPLWEPESATWRYRLQDGPSPAQDGNTSHLWVTLRLPAEINEALLSANSETPLIGSIQRLNRRLRHKFRDTAGLTATAHRLCATSWLIMRPLATDSHIVNTLRGEYGQIESAPAAYRRTDSTTLQKLFDTGLRRCGIPVQSAPSPDITNHYVGSSRVLTASEWRQWTTSILEAIGQARDPLELWLSPDPLPIESVVEYVQLASAYAYLGWLLSTGARPVSANTQSIVTGTRTWISDKASRRGKESRVIPLHKVSARQLQSHCMLIEQTIHLLNKYHYPIEDLRRPDQQWPAWMSLTHHNQPRCRIRAIHHSDFRKILISLDNADRPLGALLPSDNATRHSMTTALYRTAPEAELDALVGHARIGRDRNHPRANAPIQQSKACQQEMTAWLKAIGYRELDMEIPPWH